MLSLVPLLVMAQSSPSKIDPYDVVWTTPSVDAAGSMPIGNGEVVLNVWVEEATGDLLFYIARTDAMSEISRYLKLGRVRVHFSTDPFKGDHPFRQQLHLHDGVITISGGTANLVLYVDAKAPIVSLAGTFAEPTQVTATIEDWRDKERELPKDEQRSAWSVYDAPFKLVESADAFLPRKDAVTWYHRNETSVVPELWKNQSLTGLKGAFDPLLHRTFGGRMTGRGFKTISDHVLQSESVKIFRVDVATHTAQTKSVDEWEKKLAKGTEANVARTMDWWHAFWDRSWVIADGSPADFAVPKNDMPLRRGVDSGGGNVFPGKIREWRYYPTPNADLLHTDVMQELAPGSVPRPDTSKGFTLQAWIEPDALKAGRIFDNVTAGVDDGFLFDTYPGDGLRLIVGRMVLSAPKCLKAGQPANVVATYDAKTGEAAIYLEGKRVAHHAPSKPSTIGQSYQLQRYVQACQGRGEMPIKFNGGFYTVEPKAMGHDYNADWRQWGDSQWFQNVRHMYHPMIESGDYEMMDSFFRLYERVRPLAESRTELYHGAEGAYFPETMSAFGTYSGGDYGWDRTGKQPKDVNSPWWRWAWNQGLELSALMLDRWDYTRDEAFLKKRVLPMAESVLKYFDTRFKKDAQGKIILDPAQSIETYWEGVVNDMPCMAGLNAVTTRLCALPPSLVSPSQKAFFAHMKAACPALPLQDASDGRELSPAEKYVNKTSNVENPELYAVWPFENVSLAHPALLEEAKRAYAHRKNKLDVGWGYDGNVAALLGMTDEAARILTVKCANSNALYRWPATWGPNFDWLPDQNHGGNLLKETNLMLLQASSLEDGGAIRLLPAWPLAWDVQFKLHAPGNTTVECEAKGGKIVRLVVTPESRTKDVVWPAGWTRP